MAIKKKNPLYRPKPGYLFNSSYEELKILSYLRNLINSTFLHHKTNDLFDLTVELLGQRPIIEVIKSACPELIELSEFEATMRSDYNSEAIPINTKRRLLKQELTHRIEKRIKVISTKSENILERRLKIVKKLFQLNRVETEILLFLFLKGTISCLDNVFSGDRNGIADFTMIQRLRSYGHFLLGIKRAAFVEGFSEGNLLKAQVLERSGNPNFVNVQAWCMDYLSGLSNDDLSLEFFSTNNDEALLVDDFEISKEELSVLDTIIASSKSKNILFYGAPGSGKTSFALSLIKKYSKQLMSVKTPDSGEHNGRLRALYATTNLADKQKTVVLVDEADEILNTSNSFFFRSVTQKSWINTFLDTHGKKVIWIANRSNEIDSSTMRRFSFSMEFKKIDKTNRMKVLKYELEKSGIKNGYFSEEELKDLCNSHSVDAGGVVNAIRTVAIRKTKKVDAIRKIKTILKNHENATGGRKTENIRERTFDAYTIKGLNTSCDLGGIVSGLKEYADNGSVSSVQAVSILLYGMPGTGKTEFVYYLGNVLKKDVVLKRASEIQSKWVGETEKNIASAFGEAGERGGILFFDEADSFLFPRKDAMRSWEKSHTNEILTQLENFNGIVIFATNDIDGLDHAALRRFRFKVRFDPLTPEGNVMFYKSLMNPLVSARQPLSTHNEQMLRNIRNLTPGDFAVVKDQFSFFAINEVTHEALISALLNEVRYKKSGQDGIGFNRC